MIGSAGGQRVAQAALDAARPAIARLDESRSGDDLAADLLEAWEGVERALRALAGVPTLSGQSLIREARQRDLLTLDQAHALIEFSASCERARETTYEPQGSDIQNARVGFHQMESVLTQSTVHSAPIQTPTRNEAQATPGSAPAAKHDEVAPPVRRNILGRVLVSVLAVALLAVAGFYVWQLTMSAQAAVRKGVAAYAAGRRSEASHQFDLAVERDPGLAVPHVYAGRMYREDGNYESAALELKRAIELEPRNALALREMGSYLLARGNFDLARAFYVRALSVDPEDKLAMGFLGCALARLGRYDEAQRFAQRAGPGAWSACLTPPPPVMLPAPR